MDYYLASGMAKEGFDWPYCEHALTVGYRASLTEIIQNRRKNKAGRVKNKTHGTKIQI